MLWKIVARQQLVQQETCSYSCILSIIFAYVIVVNEHPQMIWNSFLHKLNAFLWDLWSETSDGVDSLVSG